MKLNNTILKTAIAASLAFAGVSAQAAVDLPDFTINPDLLTSTPNSFVSDRMRGSYDETITFGAGNTFQTSVFWKGESFRFNDDNDGYDAAVSGLTVNYGLYVLFQGSGTWSQSPVGPFTQTKFDFAPGGSFSFYYDVNNDSARDGGTNPTNGSTLYQMTNNLDDLLLFSGSLFGAPKSSGSQLPIGGQNNGSFGTVGDITLTADGKKFFVAPDPFYELALTSGDFTRITPQVGTTQRNITGGFSIDFQKVPEPEVLSLLGIGLLGFGFSSRKKA